MFVTPVHAEEVSPVAGEPPLESFAHTETGADHGSSGFPPFDSATFPSQLLWLAITFGLFYLFLKKVVLPRIGSILEVRRDRIAQDIDQASRMKQEADAAVAAYEQELGEARNKANVIGQEARDNAKAEAEAARRKTEIELEKKLADAEQRIASIKLAAMKEVGAIAEDTALAIVERLADGKGDKAAVAAAVKAARG